MPGDSAFEAAKRDEYGIFRDNWPGCRGPAGKVYNSGCEAASSFLQGFAETCELLRPFS